MDCGSDKTKLAQSHKMALLTILVQIFVFGQIFIYLLNKWKSNLAENFSIRIILISSCVLFGLIIFILTEGLSSINQLSPKAIWISWMSISLTLFLINKNSKYYSESNICYLQSLIKRYLSDFANKTTRITKLLIILLIIQFLFLGLQAIMYPPISGDGLTYHIPRVMHWIQNRSVDLYATNIDRQVQMPPFGEYILLHLFALSGSDIYANFVQWISYVGCVIGISFIVKILNGDIEQQVTGAIICASIPMAILQSTSTQNDMVVSFWIMCFVIYFLLIIRDPMERIWPIFCGLSLGLALLSKATAYIFVAPFCLVLVFVLLRNNKKIILNGFIIIIIAFVINILHYSRMYTLYKSPLGPNEYYSNSEISIASFSSNLIRNTALNFAYPWIEPDQLNPIILGLKSLHNLTGFNEIDKRNTMGELSPFRIMEIKQVFYEDTAGNPIHLLLAVICVPIILLSKKNNRVKSLFAISIILGAVFFSGYLRYQSWGVRLQLPLFVLSSAIISISVNPQIRKFITLVLVSLSFLWVYFNSNHDQKYLIPNLNQQSRYSYFPEYYSENIIKITQILSKSKCKEVGLDYGGEMEEYRIWAWLMAENWQGRIEHIGVRNETRKLRDKSFSPCAIITDDEKRFLKYDKFQKFENTPFSLFILPDFLD